MTTRVIFRRLLFLSALVILSPVVADGATFSYSSGNVGGQRGLGMTYGSTTDNGWVRHYNSTTDPNPNTDSITIDDATASCIQSWSTDFSTANEMTLTNRGVVDVTASPTAATTIQVGSMNVSGQAHADSFNNAHAFYIAPSAGQSVGDDITLVFTVDMTVQHEINGTVYNTWTDDGNYHVKGQLGGQWPAPFTVLLQSSSTNLNRPILRAAGNPTSSTTVFDQMAVNAKIGDTIIFDGGPLSWLEIDSHQISSATHIRSDIETTSEVQILSPVTLTTGTMSVSSFNHGIQGDCWDYNDDTDGFEESTATSTSWHESGYASLATGPVAQAEMYAETYDGWLAADADVQTTEGEEDTGANASAWYQTVFTLSEATDYQLQLSLTATGDGMSTFILLDSLDNTVLEYANSTYTYTTGQLAAGQYELTVFAEAENGDSAGYDFDFTFGQPETIPEPASLVLLGLGALGIMRKRQQSASGTAE